jgi:epoxide hydrolase-like predicted phosphatase
MVVDAVIFDLGGVLVRTEDRKPRTQLAARLDMTYDQLSVVVFDSQSAIQAMKGEISAEAHWQVIKNKLGLSDQDLKLVQTDFWAGDVLDENLVNFLRQLRPRYKTALLSNAWDDLRQMIEEVWQIADAFDRMVISSEVGLVKPDQAIYQRMIAELGVAPSKAVFVDDFQHNVEGARSAGLKAIHFQSPEKALGDLQVLLDGD